MSAEKFLQFNEDNIFQNLLQLEDHFRHLSERNNKLGHGSCCTKHLHLIIGECNEAISHSSLANPAKTEAFVEIRGQAKDLMEGMSGKSIRQNIMATREMRKISESLNPARYSTTNCRACDDIKRLNKNIILYGGIAFGGALILLIYLLAGKKA